ESAQDRVQLARGIGCSPGSKLNAYDDRIAVRTECCDDFTVGISPTRCVSLTGPVQEVDASLDGVKHVVWNDAVPASRGQSQPADRLAERGRRTRHERAQTWGWLPLIAASWVVGRCNGRAPFSSTALISSEDSFCFTRAQLDRSRTGRSQYPCGVTQSPHQSTGPYGASDSLTVVGRCR